MNRPRKVVFGPFCHCIFPGAYKKEGLLFGKGWNILFEISNF